MPKWNTHWLWVNFFSLIAKSISIWIEYAWLHGHELYAISWDLHFLKWTFRLLFSFFGSLFANNFEIDEAKQFLVRAHSVCPPLPRHVIVSNEMCVSVAKNQFKSVIQLSYTIRHNIQKHTYTHTNNQAQSVIRSHIQFHNVLLFAFFLRSLGIPGILGSWCAHFSIKESNAYQIFAEQMNVRTQSASLPIVNRRKNIYTHTHLLTHIYKIQQNLHLLS